MSALSGIVALVAVEMLLDAFPMLAVSKAGGDQLTWQVGVWLPRHGLRPFLSNASRAFGREVQVAPWLLFTVAAFDVRRLLLAHCDAGACPR